MSLDAHWVEFFIAGRWSPVTIGDGQLPTDEGAEPREGAPL